MAYPKTVDKLINLVKQEGGDFTVDCCKKPLVEKGLRDKTDDLLNSYRERGFKRLIALCPNCYRLFKDKGSDLEVISIYQYLEEKQIGSRIKESINIFFPCSDRYHRDIFSYVKGYLSDYKEPFDKINCCGLGGGAIKKEGELVRKALRDIASTGAENIYTYCASCSMIFAKNTGLEVRSILSEILETHEEVDDKRMKNFITFKFKHH